MNRILNFGMVGGGAGAFIGGVHRTAACMDHRARFVAGALSSTPERSIASGKALGLTDDRNYPTWEAMLAGELARPPAGSNPTRSVGVPEDRIDFVSIVTPNHMHFPVARAFTEAGFNVVCDKPLVHTGEQAAELTRLCAAKGTVFAVTYNYSGYPMVKQARAIVAAGELGAIRKVIVEYHQGWLAGDLGDQKQAAWRADPAKSGAGGAVGDIGTHAEQLASYVSGLDLESVCGELTAFVPGRRLDDDANLLLRFRPRGGVAARGVLIASQIAVGCENDLRLRVFGETGSLEWRQEEPNQLVVRSRDIPERVLRRGNAYLGDAAKKGTRLPSGHPEAFLEAFANVYANAMDAMLARAGGPGAAEAYDFPGLRDGARGVALIEAAAGTRGVHQNWTRIPAE